MKVTKTLLPGVLIVEPQVFGDHRGFFMETYSHSRYAQSGIDVTFVQDNMSVSSKGILRGLHFQFPKQQGKLVQVIEGEVYDVAVDIRVGSPTFGKWVGQILSEENKCQFYVPPGFAHGFAVKSEKAIFFYKCSDYYSPDAEHSIRWNDPDIGIEWPIENPTLSSKDSNVPFLRDFNPYYLPKYIDTGERGQ